MLMGLSARLMGLSVVNTHSILLNLHIAVLLLLLLLRNQQQFWLLRMHRDKDYKMKHRPLNMSHLYML